MSAFSCQFCFALIIFISSGVLAQTSPTQGVPPRCDPAKLSSLVGTVSLSLGTDEAVQRAMPCLLRLWRESGKGGGLDSYVSNAFLAVMEENPAAFFSAMMAERPSFEKWLDELPDLSFTWSKAPPCGLEEKRKQLVSMLQHSEIADPKASALRELASNKLSSIRCRQID